MSYRFAYRTRQVVQALWPRVTTTDLVFARGLLNEDQRRLFDLMERRDQRHALEVMRRVRLVTDNHDVLVAALLHDCGKGAVPIGLRILKVLSPAAVRRLAHESGASWRAAAYRLSHHEVLSARLAEAAGSSDLTVRLIAGAPLAEEREIAALLVAADDAS